MKKIFFPKDLLNIYKLFKKTGIKNFESALPSLILDLIYSFVWELLFKSRKLARYAGRIDITKNDIQLACRLELEYICFNPFKLKEAIMSSKILNSLLLKERKIGDYIFFNYDSNEDLKKDFKIKK